MFRINSPVRLGTRKMLNRRSGEMQYRNSYGEGGKQVVIRYNIGKWRSMWKLRGGRLLRLLADDTLDRDAQIRTTVAKNIGPHLENGQFMSPKFRHFSSAAGGK